MRWYLNFALESLPLYAFLLVWTVSAFQVKRTKISEPIASRLTNTLLTLLVLASFAFPGKLPDGFLKARFVWSSSPIRAAAVVLTYVGVGIAIWARLVLGRNWSSRANLKEDHELIRRGPYAYVRHPIYSGMLLALIGVALEIGQWRALIAAALAIVALSVKAKREEQVMFSAFGENYQHYRGETGFLLPRFNRPD
jgi:protein-S-isoprenylcysteine O-methyltransferase Ste14